MNTQTMLRQLMLDNYQVDNVVADKKDVFKDQILGSLGKQDARIEGFDDPTKQRDLSIKFFWGHDHDFGDFSLSGQMGERHIDIVATFIDRFGLPRDLSGKTILDVGVWTGGTCLLLTALGAKVVALEEVRKYSDMVNFLAASFGLSNLSCEAMSVFDFDEQDRYDYVIYSGVIYHVTDPVLSLRVLFNALQDGGRIFVESMAVNAGTDMPPLAFVEGPTITRGGDEKDLSRGGWNYFIPSGKGLRTWMQTVGFGEIDLGNVDQNNRILAAGTRVEHQDMLRAGLSRSSIR